jgi:alpha-beta hydrolase superfamily lysophospholipase
MHSLTKLDHPEILSLLLQPPRDFQGSCPERAEDLYMTIFEGVSLACRFYISASDAPTLIYFHGGCESSDSFNTEAESFNRAGINVFLASYRGSGKSSGTPSLSTLLTDAGVQFSLAIDWLAANNYTGTIFVMGRSLGSVCALDVVFNNSDRIKALILESAYCETLPLLVAIGAKKAVEGIVEDDGFNNLQKIAKIKTPTLIFHGSRDVFVPVSQAEKLQAASGAKNKQFLIIPGAEHYTVAKTGGDMYFKTIKGFLDTICGVNTWRQRRTKFKADQEGGNS